MADNVTSELLFERAKATRGDNARTSDRLQRIERRLESIDDHVAALVKGDMGREREFTALERRVARIEDRMNLRDADTRTRHA